MIGLERTVLPLLAREVFGLTAFTAVLSFVLAFGVTKALANLAWGALADRYGRTVFARTTFGDPSLPAASEAGLVNKLNDGMAGHSATANGQPGPPLQEP